MGLTLKKGKAYSPPSESTLGVKMVSDRWFASIDVYKVNKIKKEIAFDLDIYGNSKVYKDALKADQPEAVVVHSYPIFVRGPEYKKAVKGDTISIKELEKLVLNLPDFKDWTFASASKKDKG